ncbi:hypothetical protein JOD64_005301 [Micromonospora luteifusca]|uniref:Uncharacterized protein n=1 Tax=Micromonospora luteifusca TaxID=709860 RepID=A0ABS2M1P4_9ACTN|nr:hypothetical protein [Micromonospora luteifusca]MBM7494079.1 hypothetical protein [Micromonospora luteifusca]
MDTVGVQRQHGARARLRTPEVPPGGWHALLTRLAGPAGLRHVVPLRPVNRLNHPLMTMDGDEPGYL